VAEAAIGTNIVDTNIPDANLGQLAPSVNLLGQRTQVAFATGPTGTTARNLYRTRAGGAPLYYLLGQIPDNTTTSLYDNTSDDALNGSPPSQVYAGQLVTLTGIPTGPTGTIARRIYRTQPGGSKYQYLTELDDNTTTTLVDATPDGSLGSAPPLTNTAGGGKVALTSIAAGGDGITQRILYRADPAAPTTYKYLDTINDATTTSYTDDGTTAPGRTPPTTSPTSVALAGIPVSGPGSIQWAIKGGDPVNILVVIDDQAAINALAAATGTNGLRETLIQDGRISIAEATARGQAYLAAQSRVIETLSHTSRDFNTRSGALVTIDLPPPTDLHGTYRVQDVGIATFNPAAGIPPTFDARSSSSRYTLEDLLRQITHTTPPATTGETV